MILVLLKLMPYAFRYAELGDKKYVLHAAVAYVLDVFVAHTTFAELAGMPRKGEWTISDMLERLCTDIDNPDWALFFSLARRINRASPTGKHIKAAV